MPARLIGHHVAAQATRTPCVALAVHGRAWQPDPTRTSRVPGTLVALTTRRSHRHAASRITCTCSRSALSPPRNPCTVTAALSSRPRLPGARCRRAPRRPRAGEISAFAAVSGVAGILGVALAREKLKKKADAPGLDAPSASAMA